MVFKFFTLQDKGIGEFYDDFDDYHFVSDGWEVVDLGRTDAWDDDFDHLTPDAGDVYDGFAGSGVDWGTTTRTVDFMTSIDFDRIYEWEVQNAYNIEIEDRGIDNDGISDDEIAKVYGTTDDDFFILDNGVNIQGSVFDIEELALGANSTNILSFRNNLSAGQTTNVATDIDDGGNEGSESIEIHYTEAGSTVNLDVGSASTTDGADSVVVGRATSGETSLIQGDMTILTGNSGDTVDLNFKFIDVAARFDIDTGNGTGGDGDDTLTMSSTGTFTELNTGIAFGKGNDTLTAPNTVVINSDIDLGEGDDTVNIGDLNTDADGFIFGKGNDTVSTRDITGNIDMGEGTDSLSARDITGDIVGANNNTITGRDYEETGAVDDELNGIELEAGNDSVTFTGTVAGDIDLGGGNDFLSVGKNATGTHDGGEGDDSVSVGDGYDGTLISFVNVDLQAKADITVDLIGVENVTGADGTDETITFTAGQNVAISGIENINLADGTSNTLNIDNAVNSLKATDTASGLNENVTLTGSTEGIAIDLGDGASDVLTLEGVDFDGTIDGVETFNINGSTLNINSIINEIGGGADATELHGVTINITTGATITGLNGWDLVDQVENPVVPDSGFVAGALDFYNNTESFTDGVNTFSVNINTFGEGFTAELSNSTLTFSGATV